MENFHLSLAEAMLLLLDRLKLRLLLPLPVLLRVGVMSDLVRMWATSLNVLCGETLSVGLSSFSLELFLSLLLLHSICW